MTEKPLFSSIGDEIFSPVDHLSIPANIGPILFVVQHPAELPIGSQILAESNLPHSSMQLSYERLVRYCGMWRKWEDRDVVKSLEPLPIDPIGIEVDEIFRAVDIKEKNFSLVERKDAKKKQL